jgi:hypothetical protein
MGAGVILAAVEDRSRFVARLVTLGPLPDGPEHVGWASDESGQGPHLVLMRDDDGICVVSGDQDTYATHYGGVLAVHVTEELTRVDLTPAAAEALGLREEVIISHGPAALDVAQVRQQADHLLG